MFDESAYVITGGFPNGDTAALAFDEADLVRALHAYRFFYPTVSFEATWRGNLDGGVVPNQVFPALKGTPKQFVFTPNSDTPYGAVALDLSDGPIVLEVPPGPIMGTFNDLNQLWVMDYGLPGPAKAAGGTHVVLPPGWTGEVPDGMYAGRSTTNRVLGLIRAMPIGGDMEAADRLMQSVKVYPLEPRDDWPETTWVDLSLLDGADFTPVRWETGLDYWRVLHDTLQEEPPNPAYRYEYGELAQLGIARGVPFEPDARLTAILEKAAAIGHAHLLAQSFADRSPAKQVWPGTQWEWAVLRSDNGTFDTPDYTDLYAREKWFYQAQVESPAMFARAPGAGSLYWLGLRDADGDYLYGENSYVLDVPLPVPATLFWSITVYDAETRSEILTDQNSAALRSMYELQDLTGDTVRLHFAPEAPTDPSDATRWIKTKPGVGWFVYFRIYGPEPAAFDGSWRLPDFTRGRAERR
ncbi:hypothetical protein ASE16_15580 [Leifsonia sp. Root227]|uniref:DUF1254 domain-containing protein n=1 Tax=Leifsonia sp. Root227 TaxID=1736496 RepID=UPI0007010E1F|nr:DUF1254 domain-containing protein [Leifsonia sp. Root227]KRC46825.1 hypothetical protein ASE16_15580 [Leifsonia sp. Root227]